MFYISYSKLSPFEVDESKNKTVSFRLHFFSGDLIIKKKEYFWVYFNELIITFWQLALIQTFYIKVI